MGLLKDALDLGYITLDEYEDMSEYWSDLGYEARHYGDVEALQSMMMDFYNLGFDDLAGKVFTEYDAAISFYEAEYGGSIYYNPADSRWHDSDTHQYIKDPYEWIRD